MQALDLGIEVRVEIVEAIVNLQGRWPVGAFRDTLPITCADHQRGEIVVRRPGPEHVRHVDLAGFEAGFA